MAVEFSAMKLLAVETSCEQASVALLIHGDVLSRELSGHANHSEYLLPCIQALLSDAGLRPQSLDAIAFGNGPGAFTGLRLACGVAQGMAMGAGLGVLPVSSLAALAMQCGGGRVLTLTDARMGEIYAAGFEAVADQVHELIPPRCLPPAQFVAEGAWHVVGSALGAYPELFAEDSAQALSRNPSLVPRAREVARLAAGEYAAGKAIAPELASPLYVRDKVALTTAERLARGGRA